MADIFISYSGADRIVARLLAEELQARGWSVWWDRDIPVGRVWSDVIESELAQARAVIVLWSPRSVRSDWVKNEAREANARHILLPVLFEAAKLPIEFQHVQTADLTDWKRGEDHQEFSKLAAGLISLVGGPSVQEKPAERAASGIPAAVEHAESVPHREGATDEKQTPSRATSLGDLRGLFVGTVHNEKFNIAGKGFLEILETSPADSGQVSARFGFSGRLRAEGTVQGAIDESGHLVLVGTVASLQMSGFECTLRCDVVDRNQIRGHYFLKPRAWNIFSVAQNGKFAFVKGPVTPEVE